MHPLPNLVSGWNIGISRKSLKPLLDLLSCEIFFVHNWLPKVQYVLILANLEHLEYTQDEKIRVA